MNGFYATENEAIFALGNKDHLVELIIKNSLDLCFQVLPLQLSDWKWHSDLLTMSNKALKSLMSTMMVKNF